MSRIRWISFGSVITAMVALGGCTLVGAFRADEAFNLTFDDDGITSLSIVWTNGRVTVAVDENATEITAAGTKFVNAETQEAADGDLDVITVELSASESVASRAVLRFEAPRAGVRVYGADVEVTLPAGLTLNVESANGDIRVRDNQGDTTIDLANGQVTISNTQGDLTINLANGNVAVTGLEGDAAVEVANGRINLESTGGDVVANAVNGDVDVRARPAANGTLEAGVTTGSVSIQVPSDFAATLELESGLVGSVDATLGGFTVTALETRRTRVVATLNGGGGSISASTVVGSVEFASLD